MRDRRTEEGQHSIAQQLRNRAFVAIDRLAHSAVRPRDDLLPLLGVQLLGDGGGTDDVGEENGDRFAFPFDL